MQKYTIKKISDENAFQIWKQSSNATIFTNPNKIFLPIFLILFTIGLLLIMIRLFFIKKFFFTGLMLILFSLIILFFGYVFEYLGIISKNIKK